MEAFDRPEREGSAGTSSPKSKTTARRRLRDSCSSLTNGVIGATEIFGGFKAFMWPRRSGAEVSSARFSNMSGHWPGRIETCAVCASTWTRIMGAPGRPTNASASNKPITRYLSWILFLGRK